MEIEESGNVEEGMNSESGCVEKKRVYVKGGKVISNKDMKRRCRKKREER
jgi:hypothetical protein